MNLHVKRFEDFTLNELVEIYKFRIGIFVIEQNCPYAEIDDKDKVSYHIWLEEGNQIIAYCRAIPVGISFDDAASVGRVCSGKRRCGLGTIVVNKAIDIIQNEFHAEEIAIHAQTYAKKFYEQFGFRQNSEEFIEDDIPHIEMRMNIK